MGFQKKYKTGLFMWGVSIEGGQISNLLHTMHSPFVKVVMNLAAIKNLLFSVT